VFSILIIFGQMIQWTNRSILKLNFSEKKSVLLINHKDLAAITTTTIILVSLLQPTVRHLESEYRIITVTPGEMMRHKSVHQYFKHVISVKKNISVKILGPTSARGSVCSQSIYSIYSISIFRFIINRSQKSTGIPQCWVFLTSFLSSLLGLEALSTYHGLLRTISSPQANMNHEPSIILFPDFNKWEKSTRLHNT